MGTPRIGRRPTESVIAPVEPTRQPPEIDAAVAVLFEYLPEDAQKMIREVSEYMALPVWQVLLGYVMRCWDGQLMYSPHILSSWENGGKPNKPRPCLTCGGMFSSRFPDASYCCNYCAHKKLDTFGHAKDCPVVVE